MSLHIGVNRIDPTHYGNSGDLPGCENDARAMEAIARGLGYRTETLLSEHATSRNVVRFLESASKSLVKGDILFLTYAGHGAQVPDTTGDEEDGQDETWCLYDRMLLDDELYSLWGRFRAGVRIVMLSDSCHSGTMARFFQDNREAINVLEATFAGGASRDGAPVYRILDRETAGAAYRNHLGAYRQIERTWRNAEKADIAATVAFISACADNQLAADLGTHGRFTTELLKVWNKGRFGGSHYAMWKTIAAGMPPTQSPKFSTFGAPNAPFDAQSAFAIQSTREGADMSQYLDLDAEANRLILGPPPYVGASRSMAPATEERRCHLQLAFPRSLFDDLSPEQFAEFLKGEGCTALMKAYLAGKTTLPVTRGRFSGDIRCDIDTSGKGGCSGSIRFDF